LYNKKIYHIVTGGIIMTFTHNHYVPILKWKRGEQTALEKLDNKYKQILTPLIEIQPVQFDHSKGVFKKTIDEHIKAD
jgi:Beta protein